MPSLLRDFSAPVIVKFDYSEAELTHLMAHDANAFNRWEAGQRLALELMLRGIAGAAQGTSLATPQTFVAAFARVLADASRDPAFRRRSPGAARREVYIAEQLRRSRPGGHPCGAQRAAPRSGASA